MEKITDQTHYKYCALWIFPKGKPKKKKTSHYNYIS